MRPSVISLPGLIIGCTAMASAQSPRLTAQASGTSARLQAVSVVSDRIAWLSGTRGTWVRTTDGGSHWVSGQVPGADSLEFRDVHAADSLTAWLLSAGPGERSRIYRTTDGGLTWSLQFTNPLARGFFDCLSFWDERAGLAMSDNVEGTFPLLSTRDGGLTWSWLSDPAAPAASPLPAATEGEGGFAASGTCLITRGTSHAWIATGAGKAARVIRTRDRGAHWEASTVPVIQGTGTTGLTSVAFRDEAHGLAVGGDIGAVETFTDNVARTSDGGATWALTSRPPFSGAIYGAVYVPGAEGLVVVVGPKGAAWSPDDGTSWTPLDSLNYWSAGFASRNAGWLVGPGGRVVKVEFGRAPAE